MRRVTTVLAIVGAFVLAACAPAQIVDRGPTNVRQVTLTFDVAYDPRYTAGFLDVLDRYGVDAVMFVTGEWARANPALVRRMASAGHIVANHTDSHPYLTQASDTEIARQLTLAERAISALTGRTTKPYVRPPYGDQNQRVNQVFGNEGYRYDVLWTVDSWGWRGLTWQQVVGRCIERAAPGVVYMFHLGSRADLDALPWIIQWLRDQGFGIVRLDRWYA